MGWELYLCNHYMPYVCIKVREKEKKKKNTHSFVSFLLFSLLFLSLHYLSTEKEEGVVGFGQSDGIEVEDIYGGGNGGW